MSDENGGVQKLTPKEEESLRFICDFIAEHRYPPSIPDVAARAGVCYTVARSRVQSLQRKGYLSRVRYKSRSIVPLLDVAGQSVQWGG